jgi:undecaprenyl-diphosphatase
MDEYIRAVVLGLVQALTEFLPISSSGHLVLAERFFGFHSSLTFDVGLHVGTLTATLGYFWRDWAAIIKASLRDLLEHGLNFRRWDWQGRLGLLIVLGTIPAVIVGALFQDVIEANVRAPASIATLLILGGMLLAWADRAPRTHLGLESVTAPHALMIGLAQAVALIPGVSRSGSPILTARFLQYDRAVATRFSFLLSAPAITGAATLTLGQAVSGDEVVAWGPMVVGAIVSGLVGLVVIHWLLRFMQSHSLMPFVWYRVVLGVLVLAGVATSRF